MMAIALRSVHVPASITRNVITKVSFYGQQRILSIRPFSNKAEPSSLQGFNLSDPQCNVTPNIASRVGMNLHQLKNHPLCTIKNKIYDYWQDSHGNFEFQQDLNPIVSVEANFDSLLIPKNHVSRNKSDTYYLNDETVLRCHTSAHQTSLLQQGLNRFLVTGDVYRYVFM
jgi:hypothetical protein